MRCRPVALLVALVSAVTAPSAVAGGPLKTATFDPLAFLDAKRMDLAFRRSHAAGASMVRLFLTWKNVAPSVPLSPSAAADPNNRLYNWEWFDRQVRGSVTRGLVPYVNVMYAPTWAEGNGNSGAGTYRPNPAAFAAFGRAAARRYSGSFTPPGHARLPRVRYWMPWGEPNRDYHLMPQYENGQIVSARLYRELVNSFSAAVKDVNPGNVVIAGSLAPLARKNKPAPLAFMRELLCISKSLGRTCDLRARPVRFDIWSHHPYTLGGPTHKAGGDNVSLGDLPRMRRLLRAAVRAGHIRSRGRVGFWATELGWDTNPPDPKGVPSALHARWTSEALYRLWRNGVSLATWWRIQDDPFPAGRYQSGFFTADGRRKRSLTAFRFPVVAFRRPGGAYVWGRTPFGRPGTVVVELRTGSGWRRLGVLRTTRYGIFSRTYRTGRRGFVRARFGGERSLPFSLTPVRDRVVDPLGCGGGAAC